MSQQIEPCAKCGNVAIYYMPPVFMGCRACDNNVGALDEVINKWNRKQRELGIIKMTKEIEESQISKNKSLGLDIEPPIEDYLA